MKEELRNRKMRFVPISLFIVNYSLFIDFWIAFASWSLRAQRGNLNRLNLAMTELRLFPASCFLPPDY